MSVCRRFLFPSSAFYRHTAHHIIIYRIMCAYKWSDGVDDDDGGGDDDVRLVVQSHMMRTVTVLRQQRGQRKKIR